ncbi:MAG: hypothetical protein P4L64_13150 [Caulobacteraceae bacterium]|nr:hypothetical protein [Caulobacteraceae bacterium]
MAAMGEPSEKQTWISARAALEYLSRHYRNENDAKNAIIDRAAIGRVAAICETRQTDTVTVNLNGQSFPGPVHQETDHHVSTAFWVNFRDKTKRAKTDWVAGASTLAISSRRIRLKSWRLCSDGCLIMGFLAALRGRRNAPVRYSNCSNSMVGNRFPTTFATVSGLSG